MLFGLRAQSSPTPAPAPAALEEEMDDELKLGPIVTLGRPYMDVWAEESYTESLEQRRLHDRDGGYHHHHHHQVST